MLAVEDHLKPADRYNKGDVVLVIRDKNDGLKGRRGIIDKAVGEDRLRWRGPEHSKGSR